MSSSTQRLNRIIVVDGNNATVGTVPANDIASKAALVTTTTNLNTLTTNLANNYSTSTAIQAAYLLKSDAAATYQTATQVQNLINTTSGTSIVTPTITPTASSSGANTSGTISVSKSLATYNAGAKIMTLDASVTVPTAVDATLVSTAIVTVAPPSGVTFSASQVFGGAINGSSANGSVLTPIQYILPPTFTLSGGNLVITLVYQPNTTTDAHTLNFTLRAVSST